MQEKPPLSSGRTLGLVGLAVALLVGAALLLPEEAGEGPAGLRLLACLADAPTEEREPLARRFLDTPGEPAALYALAWCQLAVGEHGLALDSLKATWTASQGSDPELRAQIEEDLVFFFDETSEIFVARDWGEEVGLPGLYPAVAELYAAKVAPDGHQDEAIAMLRTLLADRPLDPAAPRWSDAIVAYTLSRWGPGEEAFIELNRAAKAYTPASPWGQANGLSSAAEARDLLDARLKHLEEAQARWEEGEAERARLEDARRDRARMMYLDLDDPPAE